MTFRAAIDRYLDDQARDGRLNSQRSIDSYRASLERFANHVSNRPPHDIGRTDVKGFLRLFVNPNTQRRHRSMLVSFFNWSMWEGHRPDNPALQTRPPKARAPQIYRLTLDEVRRYLLAANTRRERRIAFLGVCAGLRREELRLLQGRHFAREGWVWVSADIAKGHRERWVPVMGDLAPVIAEIVANVGEGEYVIPAQQYADPPRNRVVRDYPAQSCDGKTIWRTTRRIGKRALIPAPVNPHMMRHAFADHVARFSGLREAQAMLGHADVSTTDGYLGGVRLDDLTDAISGVTFLGIESPAPSAPQTLQWRRWESNPRQREADWVSAFLRPLFESPIIREAARRMA